ncbi:hypothetical protein SRABI70_04352 [Pseudomonas sp. Bi70]|nr:hypothetical protein SRABI70_04352 [Pseudomonas sp. Bi70]
MQGEPALAQGSEHAHRLDGFGLAQVAGSLLIRRDGQARRLAERHPGHTLVEPGQRHQHEGADQGQQAEPRAEQKDHAQIHRKPGGIEEREQRISGRELAQAGEIAQRLGRGLPGIAQIGVERGVEHPPVEVHVQSGTEADHQQAANPLQGPGEHEQADHDEGQHQQGHGVARGEHPVVDLQHVERRRQHQQIDRRREQANVQQPRSAGTQGLKYLVASRGNGRAHAGTPWRNARRSTPGGIPRSH